MNLQVSERLHIAPLGYEEQRVYKPAVDLKADRIVILVHNDNDDESKIERYSETVRSELERATIDYEFERVDLFDLYGVLGRIAHLITDNKNDEIFVNLATGSKVSAIAGMIACMATGEATPYYVRARDYEKETPRKADDPTELPAYPVEAPKAEQVKILAYLDEEGGATKRELIEFGEESGLPFVADHDVDEFKAKYRLLDDHILDSLENRGYVEVVKRGREKLVRITELGDDTRRGFEYLID